MNKFSCTSGQEKAVGHTRNYYIKACLRKRWCRWKVSNDTTSPIQESKWNTISVLVVGQCGTASKTVVCEKVWRSNLAQNVGTHQSNSSSIGCCGNHKARTRTPYEHDARQQFVVFPNPIKFSIISTIWSGKNENILVYAYLEKVKSKVVKKDNMKTKNIFND